jgi:hypothetical protein
MNWETKIENWLSGDYQTYPQTKLKKRFFYETSPITKDMKEKYQALFIECDSLEQIDEDYSSFNQHIEKAEDQNVTSFYNLSKSAYLIIPIPRKNKQFTTIKDFIDNASERQQKNFWKEVAKSIVMMLEKHDKVWVSTHGLGVPYLHIRIDTNPKYYQSKIFKKM